MLLRCRHLWKEFLFSVRAMPRVRRWTHEKGHWIPQRTHGQKNPYARPICRQTARTQKADERISKHGWKNANSIQATENEWHRHDLQACTDYGKRREVHVLLIFSSQEHKTGAGKMHSLKLLYILLEYSFFHLNQVKLAIRKNTRVQILGLLA